MSISESTSQWRNFMVGVVGAVGLLLLGLAALLAAASSSGLLPKKEVDPLAEKGIANVTYGRAAKLVAVYLKSMIVLGPDGPSSLASIAHPPIDRILLRNLASSDVTSPHKSNWRTTTWTTLDEQSYYALISQLRGVLAKSEPFWKLEKYWTVTND